jgi:hypothetical protein
LHSGGFSGFDRRAVHLVDGTGLFADGHTAGEEGVHWLSGNANNDPDPELVFDLGAIRGVQSMRIWNYNEAAHAHRGVKDFEVLVSADGVSYDSLGMFSLLPAPGTDGVDFSQRFAIDTGAIQFIKFDILSNHNNAMYPNNPFGDGDNGYVGLSEVRFYVPEPSGLALSTLGLLGLGLVGLRRRR